MGSGDVLLLVPTTGVCVSERVSVTGDENDETGGEPASSVATVRNTTKRDAGVQCSIIFWNK
jgi:hypothetical protein